MFIRNGYQAPTRDFLDSKSKVWFYTTGTLALDSLSFWHTERALRYVYGEYKTVMPNEVFEASKNP